MSQTHSITRRFHVFCGDNKMTANSLHISPELRDLSELLTRQDSEFDWEDVSDAWMRNRLVELADALLRLEEQLESLRAALEEARKPADLGWLTDKLHRLELLASPPSVDELREVVAEHVRNTEPMATSQGVAVAVRAFLVSRGERKVSRPPYPGEYADPQPVAVDTGASTSSPETFGEDGVGQSVEPQPKSGSLSALVTDSDAASSPASRPS